MGSHTGTGTREASRASRRVMTTVMATGLMAASVPAAMQADAAPMESDAAAARTSIAVVQHNTDQFRSSFQEVVALGGSHDVLLAEEVCETWAKEVESSHPQWTVSFHRQRKTAKGKTERVCDGASKWKGVVAIHTGAGGADARQIPYYAEGASPDPDQDFGMACVKFTKGGTKVHACATHLQIYGDKDMAHRTHQTLRIKAITDRWIAEGDSVIVGGDFNARPDDAPMTNMYKPKGDGEFVEAHQLTTGQPARTGRRTAKWGKIDYIFYSANRTPLKSGGTISLVDTRPDEKSHLMIKSTATLR